MAASTVDVVLASLEQRLERALESRGIAKRSLRRILRLLRPHVEGMSPERGVGNLLDCLHTDRQRRDQVLEDLARIRATLEAKDLATASAQIASLIAFVEKVDPAVGL